MLQRILTWAATTLFAATALANPMYVEQNCRLEKKNGAQITTVVDDLAINTDRWTGWLNTAKYLSVCFDVDYTYSAATGVRMRCESSRLGTEANDAGAEIPGFSPAYDNTNDWVLVSTAPAVYEDVREGDFKTAWCIKPIYTYTNCVFYDKASADASDKVTVNVCGVTP